MLLYNRWWLYSHLLFYHKQILYWSKPWNNLGCIQLSYYSIRLLYESLVFFVLPSQRYGRNQPALYFVPLNFQYGKSLCPEVSNHPDYCVWQNQFFEDLWKNFVFEVLLQYSPEDDLYQFQEVLTYFNEAYECLLHLYCNFYLVFFYNFESFWLSLFLIFNCQVSVQYHSHRELL